MPLAQNKAIPVFIVFIFRAYVHLLKIKRYQNIHNAHIASDMSALSFHNHIHHIFAEFIGQRRQLFYLIHSLTSIIRKMTFIPLLKMLLLPLPYHHKDPE